MKRPLLLLLLTIASMSASLAQSPNESAPPQVKTANGILEGENVSGILTFKGIPYAAPPVGERRWKEPQPLQSWKGVRKATKYGPRAMQLPLFSDMVFRSDGMSEDCLYLNIWTPSVSANQKLPVMVYFYGGGLTAGDGSEPRYEGENMARHGIVAVNVNYRLTVFGFFSHPELTRESPHHSSGNYGLFDQNAALKWVYQNIAVFGGDSKRITIAGESAGSFSVSAQMASPLSKNLIAGAIGESGSLLGKRRIYSLADAEQQGVKFATLAGANSLKELRAMSAEEVLQATSKPGASFPIAVDGYFFPETPVQIFEKGEQAHVPLLAGWNSEENTYHGLLGNDAPTRENYIKAVRKFYGDEADQVLKVYNGSTDEEAKQAATDLASDRFTGFSTWKWTDLQATTGVKPVYRYMYERPRMYLLSDTLKKIPPPSGAAHSAEIEYALGNLPGNTMFAWEAEDYLVSEVIQSYFVNFIKTGNPNGLGLPQWLPVKKGVPALVMHINVKTRAETEQHRDRYLLLDKLTSK